MQITVENIGRIKSADLSINSITVIAGKNNTGKSTIGKSIYAFFQGTKNVEKENLNEQYFSLQSELRRLKFFFESKSNNYEKSLFAESLNDIEASFEDRDLEKVVTIISDLKEKIHNHYELDLQLGDEDEKQSSIYEVERMLNLLKVDVTSTDYKKHYLARVFKDEFSNSINSIYNRNLQGVITIKWKKDSFEEVVFKDNEMDREATSIEYFNNLGAIYIDNPFLLDEFSSPSRFPRYSLRNRRLDHTTHIKNLLSTAWEPNNLFDEYVNIDRFKGILSEVIAGNIKRKGRELQFEDNKTGSTFPVNNLATGMKSFTLLKSLIESGEFSKNDILILDEPEVHLHPIWQLKYAELIVLISLQFNLKVLVTSHSPYFIEAIELYSKKHKIAKQVNYYQSIEGEAGNIFKDVTNDLPELYSDFANPFLYLEELRDEYGELD